MNAAYFKALGSNRTFMELKFYNVVFESMRSSVLIAPLWN